MNKQKLTDIVFTMAAPLAKDRGLCIYSVEYVKEGSGMVLRVTLDTLPDDGDSKTVTIEDCESVSRSLSELLDEADPVSEAYMLEVTSPGLDRPLRKEEDFVRFAGKSVDIGLYRAIDGSKRITGILKGESNGNVTVTLADGTDYTAEKNDISSVKLSVIF